MHRWLLLVAACGTPPSAQPVTGHTAPPEGTSLVAPRSTCRLAGPWEHGQPDELRFRADGPPFATFAVSSKAELQLSPQGAFVELATDELVVRGFVATEAVRLRATRPLVIARYLVPGPLAVLHPVTTSERDVTIAPELPPYIEPVAPPRERVACKDVALTMTGFDTEAVLGRQGHGASLGAGLAIPLSVEPGGGVVAKLRFTEPVSVALLEKREAFARVVVESSASPAKDLFAIGWVASASLQPATTTVSVGEGGSGRGATRERLPKRRMVCPERVAFSVEHGGERRVVGTIAAGVEIGIVGEGAGAYEIALGRYGLSLAAGARASVTISSSRSCRSS